MTNPTPPGQVPDALLLADQYAAAHAKWELEDLYGSSKSYTAEKLAERHAARAKLERALHATHVHNPAEIEHVAGDVSKNGAEVNMTRAQIDAIVYACRQAGDDSTYAVVNAALVEAQQPAPSAAADGFAMVPVDATDAMMEAFAKAAAADVDWHGATEVERQEVRDGFGPAYRAMLAAAPQPSPTAKAAQAASSTVLKAIREANMQLVRTGDDEFMLVTLKQATPQAGSQPAPVEVVDVMADSQYLAGVSAGWNAANADDPNAALQKLQESRAGYLKPLRAARAPADSVLEDAADPLQGAANWLVKAHSGLETSTLAGKLSIGYNRAKRLHDAARKQGGAT